MGSVWELFCPCSPVEVDFVSMGFAGPYATLSDEDQRTVAMFSSLSRT